MSVLYFQHMGRIVGRGEVIWNEQTCLSYTAIMTIFPVCGINQILCWLSVLLSKINNKSFCFKKSRVLGDATNNGRYAEFYKKQWTNLFSLNVNVFAKKYINLKKCGTCYSCLKIVILYVMIFIGCEPKRKSTAMLRTFKSEGQPLLWNPLNLCVHLLFAMGILQPKVRLV